MIREIGFIGLGTVGRHMATHLTRGEYNLTVYDRDPQAIEKLKARGARIASTPMEAAKNKDMVIVILPEREEWEAALAGGEGFLSGISAGSILVDMSTHSLETTTELAEEAAERKIPFLEAPVWGTREHAINALLTVLVGGDPTLLERCREVFSHFGLNIIHVGEVGDATRMKYVVNMVQAGMMAALAEGLVLGNKFGFQAEKVLEVLDSGGSGSPLFNIKGRSVSRGDFSRNMALKYVHDLLETTRRVAEENGLELPAAEAVFQIYEKAMQEGRGEEDFSAIFKVLS